MYIYKYVYILISYLSCGHLSCPKSRDWHGLRWILGGPKFETMAFQWVSVSVSWGTTSPDLTSTCVPTSIYPASSRETDTRALWTWMAWQPSPNLADHAKCHDARVVALEVSLQFFSKHLWACRLLLMMLMMFMMLMMLLMMLMLLQSWDWLQQGFHHCLINRSWNIQVTWLHVKFI